MKNYIIIFALLLSSATAAASGVSAFAGKTFSYEYEINQKHFLAGTIILTSNHRFTFIDALISPDKKTIHYRKSTGTYEFKGDRYQFYYEYSTCPARNPYWAISLVSKDPEKEMTLTIPGKPGENTYETSVDTKAVNPGPGDDYIEDIKCEMIQKMKAL